MAILNDWINDHFSEIAKKLPTLVHTDPASFACGFNTGYKQALLDLENFLDGLGHVPEKFEDLYRSKWDFECEKHESDGIKWKRFEIDEEPWLLCKNCEQFYR